MDEYRNQRENGADVSEALTRGGLAGITSYVIERLGGLGADNSSAPKIKLTDITSILNAIVRTATQEGKEEIIEYTADSFTDAIVDAVYRGKISFDWNIEDAVNQATTGAMVGGGLAVSPTVNGRDIDIVDEMNKIISESADIETRVNNTKNLQKRLRNRKKAKQELDKLLWLLNDKNTGQVGSVTRNAFGKPVEVVEHINPKGTPNLITQANRRRGGVVRNYYGKDGKQYLQVANFNEDGDMSKWPKKKQFEKHAHDYEWEGKNLKRTRRRPTKKEWEENIDIYEQTRF